MITAAQCRSARTFLSWSLSKVASASSRSLSAPADHFVGQTDRGLDHRAGERARRAAGLAPPLTIV
jgi:hypothetical protein